MATRTRKHLVVVIPGIGGSVLADPAGQRVWDVGLDDLARAAVAPGRLSIAEAPELRPVGLIGDDEARRRTDRPRPRVWLPGWAVVRGYDGLLERLGRLPGAVVSWGRPEEPVPDANIVAFPYDFRRSVADAAAALDRQVRTRLERFGGDPAGRVILVAHSLGGLVARYWLGRMEGWRVCRAVITMGTPYRGAPKALQWMVNGAFLGGRPHGLVEVTRAWPSVAELLPRYPAVWDASASTARYPFELPIGWLAGPAARAYRVHTDMDEAWKSVPAEAIEVDYRLGWSHPTPNAATWSDGVLAVTKKAPTWLPVDGWTADRGDGTVPTFCAVPIEASVYNPLPRRLRERHIPLGSADEIADLVEAYENYSPMIGSIRGDDDGMLAVGLDVDTEHVGGEPIPISVTIAGERAANLTRARVTVAVRVGGTDRPVRDLTLDRDGTAFTGALDGLAPGLYDLAVEVLGVPDVPPAPVGESIAVTGA